MVSYSYRHIRCFTKDLTRYCWLLIVLVVVFWVVLNMHCATNSYCMYYSNYRSCRFSSCPQQRGRVEICEFCTLTKTKYQWVYIPLHSSIHASVLPVLLENTKYVCWCVKLTNPLVGLHQGPTTPNLTNCIMCSQIETFKFQLLHDVLIDLQPTKCHVVRPYSTYCWIVLLSILFGQRGRNMLPVFSNTRTQNNNRTIFIKIFY